MNDTSKIDASLVGSLIKHEIDIAQSDEKKERNNILKFDFKQA